MFILHPSLYLSTSQHSDQPGVGFQSLWEWTIYQGLELVLSATGSSRAPVGNLRETQCISASISRGLVPPCLPTPGPLQPLGVQETGFQEGWATRWVLGVGNTHMPAVATPTWTHWASHECVVTAVRMTWVFGSLAHDIRC